MPRVKHVKPAMPRGLKGEHRPADVIGAAVKVMRIATGEEKDVLSVKPHSHVANIGRKGGEMRAKTLSAEHHSEIARKTATSKAKVPLVPVEGE
jgi:hypothetical protein